MGIQASPVTSPGTQNMAIIANAVTGQDGTGNLAFGASFTYSNTPTPVAAYGFNDGSGTNLTVHDATSNHLDGVESGGATEIPSGGKNADGALVLDGGTNSLVTVTHTNSLLDLVGSPFTVEAWVNPATGGVARQYIVFKQYYTNAEMYALSGQASGVPTAWADDNSKYVPGTANLTAGSWTHLAMTYDGAYLRLYVGGILVGTPVAYTGNLANTGNLYIGGYAQALNDYFKGSISDLRIYNVVLSATQIQADMSRPVTTQLPIAPPNDLGKHGDHHTPYLPRGSSEPWSDPGPSSGSSSTSGQSAFTFSFPADLLIRDLATELGQSDPWLSNYSAMASAVHPALDAVRQDALRAVMAPSGPRHIDHSQLLTPLGSDVHDAWWGLYAIQEESAAPGVLSLR